MQNILRNPWLCRVFGISVIFTLSGGMTSCTRSAKTEPGTIRVVSIAKFKGLDPAQSNDMYSGIELSTGYETLYQYAYLKRPLTLEPNLAAAMPELSADKKTLTIKLKQGVLFHDDPAFKESAGKGREMVAQDVIYSFMRVADPKINSPSWWLLDDKVVGLNEWREAQSKAPAVDYAVAIEGFKAVDRYTVQIKLKKPSYQFVYFMAMPSSAIVAREGVEHYGKEFLNHLVGTGPFKLESFSQSKVVWVRNPNYRAEKYPSTGTEQDKANGLLADAGQPLPRSNKIISEVMEEGQTRWLNFLQGKLDFLNLPKDSYGLAVGADGQLKKEYADKGIQLLKAPMLDVTHCSFNMEDPVWGKNKYLRQALSLVIDRGPMIELFYNGRAIAAQGPIPPGLEGYDPDLVNPYTKRDLAKAKELMAKAGYPDGKGLAPIKYLTMSDTTTRQMDEYFSKAFGELGVKLELIAGTWPEFDRGVKERKGQMYFFAWGADYPDAENFLQLFYGRNVSPGPNDANYKNAEYDKLYEKSLTLPPGAERTALYKKMVAHINEETPWINGVHRIRADVVHPWLKNYQYIEAEHNYRKYWGVDDSKRK